MLESLKTISTDHSISRVTTSLYTPQAFIHTDELFQKVKASESFKDYKKKIRLRQTPINISSQEIKVDNEESVGFFLESYGEEGNIHNIFRLENRESMASVSIENRNYPGWANYREKVIKDWSLLNSLRPFYIEAVGLNYRDEFIWEREDSIPLKEIFKIESDVLNTKFFNSINGTLVLISQSIEEGIRYEEKVEISFSNEVKRVLVNHNVVIRMEKLYSYEEVANNGKVITSLDFAHKKNKDILQDVLNEQIQIKIGLKK